MTRYRDLGVTAPYDAPAGAAVQIDGMRYLAGADIHAGDHLAIDTRTGCIVPNKLRNQLDADMRANGRTPPRDLNSYDTRTTEQLAGIPVRADATMPRGTFRFETRDEGLTPGPLGDATSAPDPLEMGTIVKSPETAEPERCPELVERGGGVQCDRDAGHEGGHTWGSGVWLSSSRTVRNARRRAPDEFGPTRPRGLDALIPTRPECGAQHPDNASVVPCCLVTGHAGWHYSTTGCAGSEVRWPAPSPREAMVAAVVAAEDERLLREPETIAQALADVHRRYCAPGSALSASRQAHDPVCRILSAALAKPLEVPVGPKLGGQRQGGARTATEAAELVAPKAGTQRARVLYCFRGAPPTASPGFTDVELGLATGLPANSVRPRRVELVDAGWLEATGRTKVHHGRKHTLWTLTPAAREALR